MERQQRGWEAETETARYLCRQGLKLLERNYHCRNGELDLILADGEVLVFVEVRSRHPQALVDPAESITWRKQQRLIRAARHYLHRYGQSERPCRFDVVCVTNTKAGPNIEWIKNAIEAAP